MHEPDAVCRKRRARCDGVLVRGLSSVRMNVDVCLLAIVAMGVGMEETTPPPQQEPNGEEGDDRADQGLRSPLYWLGQITAREHQGKTQGPERRAVPETPDQTHKASLARPSALLLGSDESSHRRYVVRV